MRSLLLVLMVIGCDDDKSSVDVDWGDGSNPSAEDSGAPITAETDGGSSGGSGGDSDATGTDGGGSGEGSGGGSGGSTTGSTDDTGVLDSTNVETWEVPSNPPTDILFYIDQSCSMEDDQARLAAQATTFIDSIETHSDDWQIIVSNEDNGCNQTGGILTPSSEDYVSRFQSAISAGGGWWTEAGLTVTSQAVEMTDAGECNHSFLRDDSMLHIIMISDESDQSTSSWNWYADKIIMKKGSSERVKFSAIAGDYPDGCATAEPGEGYYQAVEATGGVYLSICSDWATPDNIAQLAEASALPTTYALSRTPIEDTIRVWLNGAERTDNWTYDAEDNAIVFAVHIPSTGDSIRVEYSTMDSE